MTDFRKIALTTGVTLNVGISGSDDLPAAILLHGFPESHRSWREIEPRLRGRFRLVMPDQRGFAGSDKPKGRKAYKTDVLVDDIFALADALGLSDFGLVGHDWGGAIAWAAALRADPRLKRLAIINAPHPVVFQKSLIESAEQRAASQYINAFKAPGIAGYIRSKGFDWFFAETFGSHVDLSVIAPAERQQYIAEWTQPGALEAMLNWYRASPLVIPPPLVTVPVPDWVLRAFPKVRVPTLVIWAMADKALLPIQLDGLDTLVDDLTLVRIEGAGHFAPWEAPDEVARALAPFLAGDWVATAPAQ